MVLTIPFWGALSDRIGRKPLLLASSVLVSLLAWPLFRLITQVGGLGAVMTAQITLDLALSIYAGALPAAIAEIFPTHLRSTWMSAGYTLSVSLFGGFAPFVSTWLIRATDSPQAPTYLFLIPSAVLSIAVVLNMRDSAKRDTMHRIPQEAP